jgi:hypothetical protein
MASAVRANQSYLHMGAVLIITVIATPYLIAEKVCPFFFAKLHSLVGCKKKRADL